MADLTIHFRFVTNAQSGSTVQREIEASTNQFARLIVEEVAVSSAAGAGRAAATGLTKSVKSAVEREISRMAMTIGTALSLTERAQGPQGVMSIAGAGAGIDGNALSQTARGLGWGSTAFGWNRSSTKIRWGKRNPKYVRWKARRGMGRNWWKASEDLHGYLSRKDTYTQSFGPVRVIFERPRGADVFTRRLSRPTRVTAGRGGPLIKTVEIGKIRVMALGNITPADLPSLRTGNPSDATPTGDGIVTYLRNKHERNKLMQRSWKGSNIPNARRFVLEPFVSFYLTRAIPNAVWRRIEQAPGMAGARNT